MDHQRAETMLGAADRGLDASDSIRVFTALRTGDPALLGALLDARPDLVDVREDWSGGEGWRHGLLPTHGGTPLLRAVERGDLAMIGNDVVGHGRARTRSAGTSNRPHPRFAEQHVADVAPWCSRKAA